MTSHYFKVLNKNPNNSELKGSNIIQNNNKQTPTNDPTMVENK